MIYTKLTNKAMQIAYMAHHGQTDCNGIPYVFHPYHLAEQMDDEISCCVALLHDVAEDTEVTLDELGKNFPQEIIEALKLLTHEKDTDYFDYVRRIKDNPIAKKVKLADLAHNMDRTRIVDCSVVSTEKLDKWD
ncbi:MAG: bifunctional (p)ppGpp synthetase/guanosine-3',5'-bis(diphosphate) 3'-pyrophosphohydrolase, partial [Ruminococcus sp.]|nr:bifunctional (p)ppGpp synthetase/guanosine-3',5'-bis(diphosphate) 3'-pyrophosphohydrolase [Ruminococcus sp.]